MNAQHSVTPTEVLWDSPLTAAVTWSGERWAGPAAPAAASGRHGRLTPTDNQWLAWRRSLWRQTATVAALYSAAHLLFGLHWMAGSARALTADLGLAEVLFVAGMMLLMKMSRTLNDPVAARYTRAQAQAGCCLVTMAALSCSPCIWWFVFRM